MTRADPSDTGDAGSLGRRRFLAGLGGAVGVGALLGPDLAFASAIPPGATRFVPLDRQVRIADTRDPRRAHQVIGPNRIRVPVAGVAGVPPSATAAVFTVTAVSRSTGPFVSVFPSGGALPEVSNVNLGGPADVAANLATVRLGGGGAVDVYASGAADLILDVIGSYVPVDRPLAEGRFVALPAAARVLDTRGPGRFPRPGDSVTDVFVDGTANGIADATAVVINLTAVDTFGWGYFTCVPFGAEIPDASNLNVTGPGQVRAAAAVVRLGRSGGRVGFRVFSSTGAHLIVDVAGYYSGPTSPTSTDGLFVPVSPVRLLDTRSGLGGSRGRLWPGWTVEARIPGPAATEASAVAVNLTAVDARGPGYFTAYAAGTARRDVSNLNCSAAGQTVANHAVTALSTRGIAVFAGTGAHVLVDYAGWFTGRPQPGVGFAVNPSPPVAAPPWTLEIPALRNRAGTRAGHVSAVYAGSADAIVDAGHVWHWTGTGGMGRAGNVGLFAHRTSAGGPWYRMHELRAGDDVILWVNRPEDRRRFRYRIVRTDMVLNVRSSTPTSVARILEATRYVPGPTVSLISCSRADRMPTSLDHRLIHTAQLVDVTEDGLPAPRG